MAQIKLEVTVDLDPIPGSFHTKESARDIVEATLIQRIGHYNPKVEFAIPE